MNESHVVKKQITINASSSRVWVALTKPELTKKYFFKCEVHSNWQVGSPITFTRKILWFNFKLKGTIVKIEPEKLLQYTLMNAGMFKKADPSKHSLVTDELKEENGKTIVSITDDVGSYEGAEKRYIKSVKGWDKVLSGLKKLLEQS